MKKEDKLIKELDKYSYSPENMNTVVPPMILPYMWESERFSENFTNLFLEKLDRIDNELKEVTEMTNLFSYSSYTNYFNTREELIPDIEEYRQYILHYIENKAPEHIWLLFKLREK